MEKPSPGWSRWEKRIGFSPLLAARRTHTASCDTRKTSCQSGSPPTRPRRIPLRRIRPAGEEVLDPPCIRYAGSRRPSTSSFRRVDQARRRGREARWRPRTHRRAVWVSLRRPARRPHLGSRGRQVCRRERSRPGRPRRFLAGRSVLAREGHSLQALHNLRQPRVH